MSGGRDAGGPTQQELLILVPFALAALVAWFPGSPPVAAYDLREIALGLAAILTAWRAGAAALKDLQSRPFYIAAAGAAWIAIWPAGAQVLPGSDVWRFVILIGAIAYLWSKSAIAPRIAYWAGLLLALVAVRSLV